MNLFLPKYKDSIVMVTEKMGQKSTGFCNREKYAYSLLPDLSGRDRIALGEFSGCFLKEAAIPSCVKRLEAGAFLNCAYLESVKIPEGITSISIGAFSGCIRLKKVHLPKSLEAIEDYAFYQCKSLEQIVLPRTLKKVGKKAFSGCTHMEYVVSPGEFQKAEDAFEGCFSLVEEAAPAKDYKGQFTYEIEEEQGYAQIVKYIGSDKNVIIPEWIEHYPVRKLADKAFADCKNLVSVSFPNNILFWGEELFSGCSSLESICLPQVFGTDSAYGIQKEGRVPAARGKHMVISKGMFKGCVKLQKLIFSSLVTDIREAAFSGCSGLKEIVLPDGIKCLADSIFEGCDNLADIQGIKELEIIGKRAFFGCKAFRYSKLPVTVKEIREEAFSGCINMKSLMLFPERVKIMEKAFSGCEKLSTVKVSKECELIDEQAFENCNSLKEIILPSGAKVIGKGHLLYRDKLDTVIIKGDFMPKFLPEACEALQGVKFLVQPQLLGEAEEAFKGKIAYRALEGSDYSNFYSYTQIEGKDAVKIQQYVGTNLCAVVPDMIEGFPVTVIGERAFENHKEIEEVILPDSVEEIQDRAFSGCEKISYFILPKKITKLGKETFYMCTGLRGITFLASEASYNGEDFSTCGQLRYITVNKETKGADLCWEAREKFSVEIQNNYAVITDYAAMGEDEVITEYRPLFIPEIIDGYPVFQIGKEVNEQDGYRTKGVFAGCEEIESVYFPPSVKEIGTGAFYHCSHLKALDIPKNIRKLSNECFRECTSLVSVNIQADTVAIGERAFFGCNNLKAVAIWAKQIQAGKNCFDECGALDAVFFHSKEEISFLEHSREGMGLEKLVMVSKGEIVEHVPYEYKINEQDQTVSILKYVGGEEAVAIPAYLAGLPVVEIKEDAFLNQNRVVWVVISDMVQQVGQRAFMGCSSLKQIILSQKIEKLEREVFSMCVMLEQIELPAGLTSIGEKAFSNCKLYELELPDKLQTIENGAFEQCRELRRIIFPKELKTIGAAAFSDCGRIRHIMLPYGITVLMENTFRNCKSLKSVLFQNPAVEKKEGAFLGCSPRQETVCEMAPSIIQEGYSYWIDERRGEAILTGCLEETEEILIPDYVKGFPVTAVSDIVFAWKKQVKRIIIGENIQTIGSMAFYGCENLEEIVFLHKTKGPRIYKEAFFALKKAVIYLTSCESLKVFKEDNCSCPVFCMDGMFVSEETFLYSFDRENSKLIIKTSEMEEANKEKQQIVWKIDGAERKKEQYPWNVVRDRIQKITLEGKISCLDNSIFEDCKNLEEVSFPDTLVKIKAASFKNCIRLSGILLPKRLEAIGEEAFSGCVSLVGTREKPFYLPDSLKFIERKAFFGCSGLKYLVFPDSVQKIGIWAFRKCSSLSEIYMEHLQHPKKIEAEAFFETAEECEISVKFSDISGLEDKFDQNAVIRVPMEGSCGIEEEEGEKSSILWKLYYDGLLEIKGCGAMKDYNGATTPWYEYSAGIKRLVMEGEITHIGAMAFHSCSFQSVELPDGLRSIGMEAFAYCVRLAFIKIPAKVADIGVNSFRGCKALNRVLFMTKEENCRIGVSAFRDVQKECAFYVNNELFARKIKLSYKECVVKEILCREKKTIAAEDGLFIEAEACLYEDGLLVIGSSEETGLFKEQNWFWEKEEFSKNNVKCLFLDENIRQIGKDSFKALLDLKEVVIKGKIKKIEEGAFGTNISDISFYAISEMSEKMLKYAGASKVSQEKW